MSVSQGIHLERYGGEEVHGACVVAYALNPKKLRRGHALGAASPGGSIEEAPSEVIKESEGSRKGKTECTCKSPTLKQKDEPSPASSSPASCRLMSARQGASGRWTGGGLADLLEGKQFPLVRFEAFDYDAIRNGVDKV